MRWIAAALLAAGCGASGSPPAGRDRPGESRFAPSPLYAGLFQEGASLSFAGRAEREDAGEHVVSDGPLAFECRVASVRGGRDFAVARLSCGAGGEWLGGLLGATASGLFRLRGPAESAAAVSGGQRLLPAEPSPGSSRPGGACARRTEVFPEGELWCASESTECEAGRPDPLRCYAAAQAGAPDPECAERAPPRDLASTICFARGTIAVASRRDVGVGSVRVRLIRSAPTDRSPGRAPPPPGAPPRARGGD